MKRPKTKYKFPHELFAELQKIDAYADRVKHLQTYQSFAIRTILQCNFSPSITLDLPKGNPPFIRDELPPENSMGRLEKQIKILGKIALIGPNAVPAVGLEAMRNEGLFVRLLESINGHDADIILLMKDKKLTKKYSTVNKTLVKAAFPDLLAG